MPNQAELQVIDFIDGNMDRYNSECTRLLGRAVTSREAVLCIQDQQSEYDLQIYEISKGVVLSNYNQLIEENGSIPCLEDLFQYVDADSMEALSDIGCVYWDLHKDATDDRRHYAELMEQGREEEARDYREECVTSTIDWIIESECGYFYYGSGNSYSGVTTILCDLKLPFILDAESLDYLGYEAHSNYIDVIINDAQTVLFPELIKEYSEPLSVDTNYMDIPGLAIRKNAKDAPLLEAEKKEVC